MPDEQLGDRICFGLQFLWQKKCHVARLMQFVWLACVVGMCLLEVPALELERVSTPE